MRLKVITILIFTFLFFAAFLPFQINDRREEIDLYYLNGLEDLKKETIRFQEFMAADSTTDVLRQQFKKVRLSYKKIAVITDYFNTYHSKMINGPAIARIEDDSPHKIIEPHGFQKWEELLWTDGPEKSLLKNEVLYILQMLQEMRLEQDRKFKYKDGEVWEAFYQQIIRIIALGISGYDSPTALHSLPEAVAVLQGFKSILEIYKDEFCCDRAVELRSINDDIDRAINYLNQSPGFISFDRMKFIKEYLNPLSKKIKMAAIAAGYGLDSGRRPLKFESGNIFEKNSFDLNFFSPNSRYQVTPERIKLGEMLFYDKRLSGTSTRSCGSCHNPSLSFTDGLPKATAIGQDSFLSRNTPSLWNAVYQSRQFYDSRQTMLEFQVSDVVHNISEMKGMLGNSATLLASDTAFMVAYEAAYPSEKGMVTAFTLSNAIASYVRSLTAMNTRFDRYLRDDNVPFSKREISGFNLFMGKAKCGTCHFVPLFNGLTPPVFGESESEVLGVPQSKTKPYALDNDSGKYMFTHSPVHLFSFKTPTLRNIVFTAPYMHNGVYNTLEEVIDFYNDGGGAGLGIDLSNQTLPQEKLDLSKKEKKDLVFFLKTLIDTSSYRGNSVSNH